MSFIWRKFEGCSKCAMSTVTDVIAYVLWKDVTCSGNLYWSICTNFLNTRRVKCCRDVQVVAVWGRKAEGAWSSPKCTWAGWWNNSCNVYHRYINQGVTNIVDQISGTQQWETVTDPSCISTPISTSRTRCLVREARIQGPRSITKFLLSMLTDA